MTPGHHRVPDDAFAALASGHGGAEAVRRLVSVQYSRHLLLVRGVVDAAVRQAHPDAGRVRAAYDLLAAVQQDAHDAVDAVLRYPAVGAWALQVLAGRADPLGMAGVAAAAAVRGRVPCAIEVPVSGGRLTLPSVGQAAVPGRSARVVVLATGTEIHAAGVRIAIPSDPQRGTDRWSGLRRLVAGPAPSGLRLLLDDLDPYRLPGAALGGRLTPAEASTWESALRDAWTLLGAHHRTTAEEIGAAVRALTPLARPAGRASGVHGRDSRSATSAHAFGCVGLSAPRDGLTLAGTLAHEIQHAKLAALQDVVPLIRPGDTRRFYAPWRDDPRPLGGLLHGAYAHLGVSGFWRRQRHHETGRSAVLAHAEFARWRAAALQVTRLLMTSGALTAAGEAFVAGMHRTLLRWQEEAVPDAAASLARHAALSHRTRWQQRNASGV